MQRMTRIAAAAGIVLLAACSEKPRADAPRDPSWATPMAAPPLDNFFKVSDVLYRGEQPSKEGMAQLVKLGVKSVINLRSLHSDKDEIGALPLKQFHIRCEASEPEEREVIEFLKLAADPANQPVFVHCAHGSDRTGLMVAVWRIVVEGWDNAKAYEEMVKGGYGYHTIYKDIQTYVRKVDAKALREKAGLPPK